MRKSALLGNHKTLDESLNRYRSFMKKVLDARRVIKGQLEKRDIAESVILRLCANWEKFIDEHLVDCINVDHSRLSEHFGVAIPRHPSKNLCEALLFGDSYKDFRSFGDLKGFSKKILPEPSNPFLVVCNSTGQKIDEIYKIRNYLAHYSSSARRALKRVYENEYELSTFREPGHFLLANSGLRLWAYFDALEQASEDMKASYT